MLVCITAFRPDLVAGAEDSWRMSVQFGAWVVFAGLYLVQRKRRTSRAGA